MRTNSLLEKKTFLLLFKAMLRRNAYADAMLYGIAEAKSLINLDEPVATYLGVGWTQAELAFEQKIVIQHLLTMTSGLNEKLQFESEAGTTWKYNTPAYSLLIKILEKVTNSSIEKLTRVWLTNPIGITESQWSMRQIRAVFKLFSKNLYLITFISFRNSN